MPLELRRHARVDELDPRAWNTLAGDDDPFVEHAFLDALESSESVGTNTGWRPIHLSAWSDGALVGALPLYAKDESWGEFIFDFEWAGAALHAGIPYYPKLTSMVPFTPATGRRLLVRDHDERRPEIVRALVEGARETAIDVGASSVHVLFVTQEERAELESAGMRPRLSLQFHWQNAGWQSFDDYLDAFRAPARKQVRRERRGVAESGVEICIKEGPELTLVEWETLYSFYRINCARHGSYPYLRPAFFDTIRRTMPHRLIAVLAYRDGSPIAASINFEKGKHLYGRYWGAIEEVEFLHFEVCYYRLIERAIERKLHRFEAGAQGMHKLKRGLLPAPVHSAHWIHDPRLAAGVDAYLPREAFAVTQQIEELSAMSPFKRE